MSSQPVQAAPAARKGGKKLPLIAAALLALAGGGFVAYRKVGAHPPAGEAAAKPVVPIDPGVIELEPFVINLADPTGDRYFRLKLSLQVDRKEAAKRAESGLPQVKLRDRILGVLAKKRAPELASAEGKESLRGELAVAVEALFSDPSFYAGSGEGAGSSGGGGEHGGGGEAASAPAPAEESAPTAHVMDVLFTEFLVQ